MAHIQISSLLRIHTRTKSKGSKRRKALFALALAMLMITLCCTTAAYAESSSTPQTVNAKTAGPTETYTLGADKTSLAFGSKTEGYYLSPDTQTVTITNTGTGSLTLTLPISSDYYVFTVGSLDLAPGESCIVNIQPKEALRVGTHNETLTFTSDHSTSTSVYVTFAVQGTPSYSIAADKETLAFGTATEGYTAPAAQQVTITNTGNQSETLTLPTSDSYSITTSDSLVLPSGGAATFDIQPTTGLTAGIYDETIIFTTSYETTTSVDVTFTVEVAPSYSIAADKETLAFGTATEGYTAPAAQQVTITNTGNASVTLTLPTSPSYSIATTDSLTLAPQGTATFSIQPATGLAIGAHNETITFTTNHSTSASVDATFAVEVTPSYSIAADKETLAFGTVMEGYTAEGYTAPAAQQVTITNTGNASVTLTLPTSPSYSIATTDSLTLAPQGTATFSIQPATGLAFGAYNETITFTTNHSTSASVNVTFTVEVGVFTIEANKTTLSFGTATEGYTAPAAQQVTITSIGYIGVVLTMPTSPSYSITTADSLGIEPPGTATFSIQPKTGLDAGAHNETITFTTNHFNSASVEVTFTVNPKRYELQASPTLLDFGVEPTGYGAISAQTVTVTNTGNTITTVSQPSSDNYTVSSLSRSVLNPGDSATFTVVPKTGLESRDYTETITVTGSGSSAAVVYVTFYVRPEYRVTGGGTHTLGGNSGLTFTSTGNLDNFEGVYEGTNKLTKEVHFTINRGSTIITLLPEYLDTLSEGMHELRIIFTDGISIIQFEVAQAPTPPDTGDRYPIALYIALVVLSAVALVILRRRRVRGVSTNARASRSV